MSNAIAARLTADEYSRLPEELGFRSELIEGENVLAPMPAYQHTQVIENVEQILKRQFQSLRVVREAGWRIRSADVESVPGPDLMVLDPEAIRNALEAGPYVEGSPRFVIEVISPSERRMRRLQKIGLYLDAGAGAVVEIHYAKRNILVYRPESDLPETVTDRIIWPFEASFSEIFAGL